MRLALVIAVIAACSGDDDESDWMAGVADDKLVSELTIPGTHDAGAIHEPVPHVAKCQSLTIAEQLAAGVRYFDMRCRNWKDQFLIYHGAIDQDQTFDDVLATMYDFLAAHPHETLIVSVKEENDAYGATLAFEQVFANYVMQMPERWYLGAAIPRMSDARGKLVLLRRFDATTPPLGIDAHPAVWTDNATFAITDPDATLQIEDNYMVTDNALKWAAIGDQLTAARAGDAATLYLAYTSGYQLIGGLPDIPIVSDDIDARLDTYLADPANAHAHLGVLVMDFVTAARARAVIAH
jgi:1-phosphatidylinositol phosphodiesterase